MSEGKGIEYFGLVGQNVLSRELLQSTYSLQLQHREEPGAISIVDALRAGCVIVGSPVGCYTEMITNGSNGLVIQGDHRSEAVRDTAAELIYELSRRPDEVSRISENSRHVPWSALNAAKVWGEHWAMALGAIDCVDFEQVKNCCECEQKAYLMFDGFHCFTCGHLHSSYPNTEHYEVSNFQKLR